MNILQEQSIIGNLNIAPAVNWAGRNSKDYNKSISGGEQLNDGAIIMVNGEIGIW